MEDFIDEIVDTVEDFIPHKPGGIIDRERENRARREAAAAERERVEERVEASAYKAVKVAQISPETIRAITYNIQPGSSAPILPASPYRSGSVILVITPSVSVTLADNPGNAISNTGFQLPAGIPLVTHTRGIVYAYNNTSGVVQVSVMAEIYAPEKNA